jgi:penicillin-binding protein 2
MIDVNRFGTSSKVFKGASYNAAGKTGTAQVYTLNAKTYNHGATPEFLRDHALYVVFAPAEDPKIAIAMIVENAGFGAGWIIFWQKSNCIKQYRANFIVKVLWGQRGLRAQ